MVLNTSESAFCTDDSSFCNADIDGESAATRADSDPLGFAPGTDIRSSLSNSSLFGERELWARSPTKSAYLLSTVCFTLDPGFLRSLSYTT